MKKLRRHEFIGGPLDGAVRHLPPELSLFHHIHGKSLYVYAIDEFRKPKVRPVFRLWMTFPVGPVRLEGETK